MFILILSRNARSATAKQTTESLKAASWLQGASEEEEGKRQPANSSMPFGENHLPHPSLTVSWHTALDFWVTFLGSEDLIPFPFSSLGWREPCVPLLQTDTETSLLLPCGPTLSIRRLQFAQHSPAASISFSYVRQAWVQERKMNISVKYLEIETNKQNKQTKEWREKEIGRRKHVMNNLFPCLVAQTLMLHKNKPVFETLLH